MSGATADSRTIHAEGFTEVSSSITAFTSRSVVEASEKKGLIFVCSVIFTILKGLPLRDISRTTWLIGWLNASRPSCTFAGTTCTSPVTSPETIRFRIRFGSLVRTETFPTTGPTAASPFTVTSSGTSIIFSPLTSTCLGSPSLASSIPRFGVAERNLRSMTRDTIFVLKVFGVPRGVTPIAIICGSKLTTGFTSLLISRITVGCCGSSVVTVTVVCWGPRRLCGLNSTLIEPLSPGAYVFFASAGTVHPHEPFASRMFSVPGPTFVNLKSCVILVSSGIVPQSCSCSLNLISPALFTRGSFGAAGAPGIGLSTCAEATPPRSATPSPAAMTSIETRAR